MSISVVINTYNAEQHLEECLNSIKYFDEIVLCDMYSTDKTVEIAERYNCKVIYHEKIGYVEPARNFAISHATGDWLFVVDADEVVPQKLSEFLKEFAQKQEQNGFEYSTVSIPRKNWFFGSFVKGDWYPDFQMRFFKKGSVSWQNEIHMFPNVTGKVYIIDETREDLAMLHYQCMSISDLVSKINTYTDFEVKKLLVEYHNTSLTEWFFKPLGVFLRMYFRQKGYKDGRHGFILALLRGALYRLLIMIKIWEFRNNQERNA